MNADAKFKNLLMKVFDECREGLQGEMSAEEYEKRKQDFAFHMTDWIGDLKSLYRLHEDPKSMKVEEATTFLIGLLYHVIPHLRAAGRLLLDDIPDAFEPETSKPKRRKAKKRISA